MLPRLSGKAAVLLAAGLCVVAVAGELVGYIAWQAYRHPHRWALDFPIPSIMQYDPELGFSHQPNLNVRYPLPQGGSFLIATNPQGFRVRPGAAHTFERADVVAIGDSQTFGWGIGAEDTYQELLASRLGVTIVNIGVSGSNGPAALLRLDRFRTLQPRVVIYGLYYDHLWRNLNQCSPGPVFGCISVPHLHVDPTGQAVIMPLFKDNRTAMRDRGEYFSYMTGGRGPYRFLTDMYWTGKRKYYDIAREMGIDPDYTDQFPVERGVTAMKFLLRELKGRAEQQGFHLIILYIPNYFVRPVEPPAKYIQEVAEQLGVPMIDPSSDFEAYLSATHGASLEIPGDRHLTPIGHKMMAASLEPLVRGLVSRSQRTSVR